MLSWVKKYQDRFDPHSASNIFQRLFFDLMLALPHILTCVILITVYPQQWLGIILVGLILPDFYYFLYMLRTKLLPLPREYGFGMINLSIKTVSHILVFVVVIFLLINQEYVLALSGGIHLVVDLVGF